MGKATLKGLLAHKFRLAATALAIVLGVSFVAGTFVLTDTIKASFDDLFKQVTQGVDVAVRSEETFGGFDTGEVRDPMPAALLDKIKAVDGVRVAEGTRHRLRPARRQGRQGGDHRRRPEPRGVVQQGRRSSRPARPSAPGGCRPAPTEMAIDAKTADDTGYKVGDQVKVLFQGPARTFTISGHHRLRRRPTTSAGPRLVGFDLATAQEVLNREGRFDEIDVAAAEGVTPEQLRDRVRAVRRPEVRGAHR